MEDNHQEVPCALENSQPPVTMRKQELMEQLRCPVCMELTTPPIFGCQSGFPHFLCNVCWERVSVCPLCKAEKGPRTVFAENFFESHIKLCQYSSNGCRANHWIENVSQMQSHEDNCKYRNINCWVPNCTYKLIGMEGLIQHWMTQHDLPDSDTDFTEESFVVVINPDNGCPLVYEPKVFHLKRDGNSFLGIFEILKSTNEVICIAYVYAYCPREKLDLYKYTVTVKYQHEGTRTESWTGLVHHEGQAVGEIPKDERFYLQAPTIAGTDGPVQTLEVHIKISGSQQALRTRRESEVQPVQL